MSDQVLTITYIVSIVSYRVRDITTVSERALESLASDQVSTIMYIIGIISYRVRVIPPVSERAQESLTLIS